MTDSYLARGGIETVAEEGGTASDIKQAAKDVKDLGTVDASFSRGKLFLLRDEAVFAPSINESTIGNFIDNFFSVGPFNPLRTLGIYSPYETSLEDTDQYSGSWRLPYSDIEGVSLLSKSSGYEIFLRPTFDSERLYRIRVEHGPDPYGFRWLYSPNHDNATKLAGELFDRAAQYNNVEEFNAGGHFTVRTKQVDFPKTEPQHIEPKQTAQRETSKPTEDTTPDTQTEEEITETNETVEDQTVENTTTAANLPANEEPSTQSDKIGGGKILLAGVLVFLIGPIFVVVLGSSVVGSVIWGLGMILLLFGAGRLIRGYLG